MLIYTYTRNVVIENYVVVVLANQIIVINIVLVNAQ